VVFDVAGSPQAVKQGIQVVRNRGEVVLIGLADSLGEVFFPGIVRGEKILEGR